MIIPLELALGLLYVVALLPLLAALRRNRWTPFLAMALLPYVALFQDLTRPTVVNSMDAEERLIFLVKEGDIEKAISKSGEHVAKLKRLLNKDIHIVEFSDDLEAFVANVVRSYEVRGAALERCGDVNHATMTVEPTKMGRAIGKERRTCACRVISSLVIIRSRA